MKTLPNILTAVLLLGTLSAQLPAQTHPAKPTPPQRLVLVELFTSEGCSSCPPADDVLRKINNTRVENALIVGISEHVTYWNHLGWSDPYSDNAFTDRQSTYGRRFELDSVYTPQVVVNGKYELVGTNQPAILGAVHALPRPSPIKVHILAAKVVDAKLEISFTLEGQGSGAPPEIYAILADDTASSHVLRGENFGRTLSHVSVARSITRLETPKEAAATVQLSLHPTGTSPVAPSRHLILFAQEANGGDVLSVETRAF